jgi:hypothetical protein
MKVHRVYGCIGIPDWMVGAMVIAGTILFIFIITAIITGCVNPQMLRVEQAYRNGQISTSEYLQLTNQLDIQNQQSRTAASQALLNYSAQQQYINQMNRPQNYNLNIRRWP